MEVTLTIPCAKCGSAQGANTWRGPKYRNKLIDVSTVGGHEKYVSAGEHLEFTCERCGYVVKMRCADAAV